MKDRIAFIFCRFFVVMFAAWAAAGSPTGAHAQKQFVEAPAGIEETIAKWLKRPEVEKSLVGIEITEMQTGKVLFALNSSKRFVPASALKTLVAACAFDSLRPDFRYQTRLGYTGNIESNALKGNLILSPSQDPTITATDLLNLMQAIAGKQIQSVEGKLVLAVPPGSAECFSPSWLVEDWGQKWMPVSSNLIVDRNIYRLPAHPGQLPSAEKTIENPASSLDSSLLQSGTTHGWAIWNSARGTVSLFRNPSQKRRSSVNLMIANPDDYNLALAESFIAKTGVSIKGSGLQSGTTSKVVPIAGHLSKPLAEILKVTLRKSDNLYAQQLLRTVGALAGDNGTGMLLERKGMQFLHAWLQKAGVDSNDLYIADACGLSRKNQITPHALNTVLRYMALKYPNNEFFDLLRQQNAPELGDFKFKTGAMDSICTITGVITSKSGSRMAFTALVNGHERSVRKTRRSFGPLAEALMKCKPQASEKEAGN